MVNIAVCGDILPSRDSVAEIAASCARRLSVAEPTVHVFDAPLELVEHVSGPSAEPLMDLLVIRGAAPGMSGMQAVRDVRKSGFEGDILLVEETSSHALEALRLKVGDYLLAPVDPALLEDALEAAVARLARLDAESVTLRVRGEVRRIPFARLVYAQTSNHDQVLHLLGNQTVQLRCSSQDLFDRLSHDARFLKLGSSYIANLDLVKSLNSNGANLAFLDGSSASVPVRFRKAVQDALFARAESRRHA